MAETWSNSGDQVSWGAWALQQRKPFADESLLQDLPHKPRDLSQQHDWGGVVDVHHSPFPAVSS
jgi:hypothetical protein